MYDYDSPPERMYSWICFPKKSSKKLKEKQSQLKTVQILLHQKAKDLLLTETKDKSTTKKSKCQQNVKVHKHHHNHLKKAQQDPSHD